MNYILDNIITTDDDPSSPINVQINALLRARPPDEFQAILSDATQINNLQLVDGDGNNVGTILPEVTKRLLAWTHFVHDCQNQAGPPRLQVPVYQPSLKREAFDLYVQFTFDKDNPTTYDETLATNNYNNRPPHIPIPFQYHNTATPTTAGITTATAATTTAAATAAPPPRPSTAEKKKLEFDRSKRNMDAYPTFEKPSGFFSFWSSLEIHANSDNCSEVLDPNYTPGADEALVFPKKQGYMFSVLDKVLKVKAAKSLLNKHKNNFDAQSALRQIYQKYTTSTQGDNHRADLLLDIQSNSMPEPLKKTREAYFTEFTDRPSGPRMYERQRKYVGPGAALALMGKSKHF